jgi:DNA-binding CsgD family transcriptional regulator
MVQHTVTGESPALVRGTPLTVAGRSLLAMVKQTGLSYFTLNELRAARMAADQATNRQIAQSLFVTSKTSKSARLSSRG